MAGDEVRVAVQALEVQAVVDALYRSAAEGREVPVVQTRPGVLTATAAGGGGN